MKLVEFARSTVKTQAESIALLGRLLDLGSAEAVYGQPLVGDGYQVLTAIEVAGGMGFGFGAEEEGEATTAAEAGALGESAPSVAPAVQVGGGGGGGTHARPVAVISLSSAGIRVEPIIDRTAVLVTFFVALGAGLLALSRRR